MRGYVSLRGSHAPLAGVVVALALVSRSDGARADDATLTACIAANESSIQRRTEHKLIEARARALECTVAACPALLRDTCKRRLDQVEAALPSIRFDVKDAAGADVPVRISMDGAPIPDSLRAGAIPVDPVEHKFVFESEGRPPLEKIFVLREGEKDRREVITLAAPSGATAGGATGASAPLPATPVDADAGPSRWSTQKTLALVAGGVGVAAIAGGSILGVMARSKWSSSQSECPSSANCPQHAQAVSDHDSATASATLATVTFVAGGALLAVGAVLWLTAPHPEIGKSATAQSIGVAPEVGPSSAGLRLIGSF